jgi:predicted Holliday junction resolvase-like endonuclease
MDHEGNVSQRQKARDLIRTLESADFCCECPSCQETIRLREAGLFYLDDFTPEALDRYRALSDQVKERRQALKEALAKIPESSERGAEAVNIGFILERIAPCMKDFSYERNDCRSLFDPIDYVIFEGLSQTGSVERIIFAEIKTGKARLASKQKEIKTLVEEKRVEMDTYDPGWKE